MSPQTLWSDAGRTRFFLISDGRELPPGELAIHTVTGRKQAVDATAIKDFEITEDEARHWLEGQVGSLLENARGAVERWVDRLKGTADDPLAPVRAAVEELETVLNRFAAASRGDTKQDSQALEEYAERVFQVAERLRSLAKI